ncbi:hypothetical protein G7062_08290 [Erysipelothrix sp. HDW6C]|uniref:aldose epimerase family protein n=1 Tax=Erysipelothrix sp. HDW6C TaxID=2714930 RepID=UPI001409A28B|nr:hypothetical protein [Erysipelothrix sp. HDW6C]QIK70290.1 hypothetical protein G7062_08290 [Erysipelothrix sp. HDW6C]
MTKQLKTMTLENERFRFEILNYGARILELSIVTEDKIRRNLVLEYSQIESYRTDPFYLNAMIGPFAGRIANGTYAINGKVVYHELNDGTNSLHAGVNGLHHHYFELTRVNECVVATTTDNDGTQYVITYLLDERGLLINMEAIPQKPVHLNLTQHTYFNLNGDSTIREHHLKIASDCLYFVDEHSIPVRKHDISADIFDFNHAKSLGMVLNQKHPQFEITKNIDHPYHLIEGKVVLSELKYGITLIVESDAPYAIIYLGNHLGDAEQTLSNGRMLRDYAGIAIEPQTLPNAINTGETNTVYDKDHHFKRWIRYTIRRR